MRITTMRLASLIHPSWRLALLVAIFSALLSGGAGLLLILHQARDHESQQIQAQGERYRLRLEQLFSQLRSGLDELQHQPLRECSVQMVARLRELALRHRFIHQAAYVGERQSCSSASLKQTFGAPRAADIHGTTYDYWLNTQAQPDDDLAALVLGRERFRVATARGHLTDVVDLPVGGSLMLLAGDGGRVIPVLGAATSVPSAEAVSVGEDALFCSATYLLYRLAIGDRGWELLLITPRSALLARIGSAGWRVLLVSVLIALCNAALAWLWARQRTSLRSELGAALRRGELRVLYQPIFNIETRQCVGAEALVRWHRADGTLTSPDLFIPLAENTGQIRQITDFVLQRLLEQLGSLLRSHPHLYVSVNLAACDVMTPRIGRVAARLLAQHQVPARQIAFEVTERSLVDAMKACNHLQNLRDRGHNVLIDDFGTGYCSLAYLQTLPVDCLKIDKAFIDALGHDAASSGVAPHIIRMAHALQLRVIAEGVEFESQALLLSGEGVIHGQGWLFSRPLSAAALAEMVNGGRYLQRPEKGVA